jgi:prepilin-type N-terminal cleavage/methylation domain-containing protein
MHNSHLRDALGTRRHAFTLVELLVVIGVIALLISILLPALQKSREQAVKVQCASNMRQWGQGLAMYCANNKGFYPRLRPRPRLDQLDHPAVLRGVPRQEQGRRRAAE